MKGCGDEDDLRVQISLLLGSGSQRQRDGVEGFGDNPQCRYDPRLEGHSGHQPTPCLSEPATIFSFILNYAFYISLHIHIVFSSIIRPRPFMVSERESKSERLY